MICRIFLEDQLAYRVGRDRTVARPSREWACDPGEAWWML